MDFTNRAPPASTPPAAPPDAFAQLMLPDEYQATRQRAFPSKGSLEWYVRLHKAQLVERGAMLKHRGIWHVHCDRFDQAVLEIAGFSAAAA
jgi:hypothetical protein